MITPAYNPTATERVLPRLALDFTTASLDSRVTVTRALNTATRVNSSGYIETINANLPRFDYDPTTLVCKGLLIEEARTNFCLYSTFANGGNVPSGWTLVLGTSGVSSASTVLGTASGAYTFTAASNRQMIAIGGITASANTTYTVTVYVEANPDSVPASQILAIVGNPSGSTVTGPTGTPTAGTRITATLTVGATAGTFDLRLGVGMTGNTSGTVRISCPQIEAGAFATSYIPTTSGSVTRNADVVSMTGTNFSSWYNQTEGAFVSQFMTSLLSASGSTVYAVAAADDGGGNNQITQYIYSNFAGSQIRAGGSGQADLNGNGSPANNTPIKIGIAFALNNVAVSANGAAPSTDSSALIPTVDRFYVGSRAFGSSLNGHVQKIMYWPQRITNAQLQAFTK